jgi:DNA-binding LacI/PurR family transcriptional regulator
MATLDDVAKKAGVSLSTASYVLSGKRPISDKTRRLVLAAMDELDFRPNNQGRALASGRSRTVALLYPAQHAMFATMPLEFVISAAAEAERKGYALTLATTGNPVEQMLSMLDRGFVDGYILMEIALLDSRVELLKLRQLPFAMIGRCRDNNGVNFVDFDFDDAVIQALDHLQSLGHHSIAMILRHPGDESNGYGPSMRLSAAFTRESSARGIDGRIIYCESTPDAGRAILDSVLKSQPDLTAVLCANLESSIGLLRSLNERGLSVPRDLSLFGLFSPRAAETLAIPITGVDFPVEEMGRCGVDFLIEFLEGGETTAPKQKVIRSIITDRGSTGHPPAHRMTNHLER